MEKRSGECEMLRVLRALIPCPSSFESKTEGVKSSEKNYNNINTTPTSTSQRDRGIVGETGAGTGGTMGVEKNKKLEVKGNKNDSSVGPEIHYESETEACTRRYKSVCDLLGRSMSSSARTEVQKFFAVNNLLYFYQTTLGFLCCKNLIVKIIIKNSTSFSLPPSLFLCLLPSVFSSVSLSPSLSLFLSVSLSLSFSLCVCLSLSLSLSVSLYLSLSLSLSFSLSLCLTLSLSISLSLSLSIYLPLFFSLPFSLCRSPLLTRSLSSLLSPCSYLQFFIVAFIY